MHRKAVLTALCLASVLLGSCAQDAAPAENTPVTTSAANVTVSETAASAAETAPQAAETTAPAEDTAHAETEPLPEGTEPPDHINGDPGPYFYDVSPIAAAYKSGSSAGLDPVQLEILAKASAVLDRITNGGMTDYDKELAVHDYIVENCTYDLGAKAIIPHPGEHAEDPYGALIDGRAICKGYTTTFELFMEMLDIPCETVYYRHPEDSSHDHAWNIVTINGSPYYVDVTWDDPVPDNGPRLTRHTNFNMSYDMLCYEHKPPESCPQTPVLTDTYASHELAPQPDTMEDIAALLKAAKDKNSAAIYFIPEAGSVWDTELPKDNIFKEIRSDDLRILVSRAGNRESCRIYSGGYADTDKGKAVYLQFVTY